MIPIKIVIPGEPVPCARPRLSTANGFVRVHDKQAKLKSSIKMMCRVEWNRAGGKGCKNEAIGLNITFYCPIPASGSTRLRNWLSWGFNEHTVSYDLDNLSKTYMDCLTGIAYDDDRQVVALNCRKVYDLKPRTEITIMEVPPISIRPKAEEILTLYGPEQFADLVDICTKVMSLGQGDAIANADDLTYLAHLISRLADNHHKVLGKVAKSVPGFYLEG